MTEDDTETRPYRLGVGALLLNADGRVWLGERAQVAGGERFEYRWQLPQGGIDENEDPRAAVMRELEEETGTAKAEIIAESADWLAYDLPPDLRGKVWKGRFRGQKQKWFALRFTGTDDDIDLNTHHKPEFSAWRWADLSELPALIVPFKRPLYDDLVAEFRAVVDALSREAEEAAQP